MFKEELITNITILLAYFIAIIFGIIIGSTFVYFKMVDKFNFQQQALDNNNKIINKLDLKINKLNIECHDDIMQFWKANKIQLIKSFDDLEINF